MNVFGKLGKFNLPYILKQYVRYNNFKQCDSRKIDKYNRKSESNSHLHYNLTYSSCDIQASDKRIYYSKK